MKQERLTFNMGQNVDVRDTKNKWVNGEIIYIKGNEAYVHYSGWSSRYDQYINLDSDRILTQWEPSKQIKINNRIDAFHPLTGWLQARVIDIEFTPNNSIDKVKVHYFNYHPKYDRWIDFSDKNQISIIGSHSKAYGIGKTRLRNKAQNQKLSQLVKKLLEQKVRKMIEELDEQQLAVKEMEGDGNCLFRSVSHQLYGTPEHHREIRLLCLQYIQDEAAFFQNYVTEDLSQYVKKKSEDGVWGDDVEIEALSEIYGRPIQIYSTSSKPLRTFHEDNQHRVEPMRLAYVGYCHYNSIKKKENMEKGILQSPFGQFQSIFRAGYMSKNNNYYNSINQHRQFFSNSNPLEDALNQNVEASQRKEESLSETLQQFQNNQINRALELSETQNILEQIEKSQIRQIQTKIEAQQLQEQIRRIEDRELQIAKEMSKKVKRDRPFWFDDLLNQGFGEKEIQFAIEINGEYPDLVLNFLLDNM